MEAAVARRTYSLVNGSLHSSRPKEAEGQVRRGTGLLACFRSYSKLSVLSCSPRTFPLQLYAAKPHKPQGPSVVLIQVN